MQCLHCPEPPLIECRLSYDDGRLMRIPHTLQGLFSSDYGNDTVWENKHKYCFALCWLADIVPLDVRTVIVILSCQVFHEDPDCYLEKVD